MCIVFNMIRRGVYTSVY